jgi:hypothetical protein
MAPCRLCWWPTDSEAIAPAPVEMKDQCVAPLPRTEWDLTNTRPGGPASARQAGTPSNC